jgi:SagB-type dehydrogenase family enzyme
MALDDRARATGKRILLLGLALLATLSSHGCTPAAADAPTEVARNIVLPAPRTAGPLSLEEAIAQRRSVRALAADPLSDGELSQLLWAAQGETDPRGFRAAPSAGALYPLEIYLVTEQGLFHYEPNDHSLTRLGGDDVREDVWRAGLEQDSLRDAPAIFVFAAVYERTAVKYGSRAERYVHLEVGHAAQNLLLQAVALDLGAVPIGAFDDEAVQAALSLPKDHAPLYLIPVGHQAD